jgi:hypothetical protein
MPTERSATGAAASGRGWCCDWSQLGPNLLPAPVLMLCLQIDSEMVIGFSVNDSLQLRRCAEKQAPVQDHLWDVQVQTMLQPTMVWNGYVPPGVSETMQGRYNMLW